MRWREAADLTESDHEHNVSGIIQWLVRDQHLPTESAFLNTSSREQRQRQGRLAGNFRPSYKSQKLTNWGQKEVATPQQVSTLLGLTKH